MTDNKPARFVPSKGHGQSKGQNYVIFNAPVFCSTNAL